MLHHIPCISMLHLPPQFQASEAPNQNPKPEISQKSQNWPAFHCEKMWKVDKVASLNNHWIQDQTDFWKMNLIDQTKLDTEFAEWIRRAAQFHEEQVLHCKIQHDPKQRYRWHQEKPVGKEMVPQLLRNWSQYHWLHQIFEPKLTVLTV